MTTATARLEVQVDSRPAKTGASQAADELNKLKGAARGAQAQLDELGRSGGKVGSAASGASSASRELDRLKASGSGAGGSIDKLTGSLRQLANDNRFVRAALTGWSQGMADAAKETDKARNSLGQLRAANDNTVGSVRGLSGALRGLPALLAAVGTAALVKGIFDVNKEFGSLRSQLEVATGSANNAKIAFGAIQAFAAQTPFSVAEATKAFITLKNFGLDPSTAALKSYANTSGALGKTLDQTIQAVADAVTGQYERLKEFGIKASVQGDKVAFTFKGVTTSVGNNAREIEGYLQNIGNTDFAGGIEKQALTVGGAASNLGDAFAAAAVKFGDAGFTGAVRNVIVSMTEAAAGSGDLASELGGLAGDAINSGLGIAKSFSGMADGAGDAIRSIRATFAGLGAVGSTFLDPIIAAFEALTSKIDTSAITLRGVIGKLLEGIDLLNQGGNKVFGTAATNYAGQFYSAYDSKRAGLQSERNARVIDDPRFAGNGLSVFKGMFSGAAGDPLAAFRGAPGGGAGGDSAAEAKKAASEAAKAARELDTAYRGLVDRYDAVGAAQARYASDLADIAKLEGRLGAETASSYRVAAQGAKFDAIYGKSDGPSVGKTPALSTPGFDQAINADFDAIGRKTGETIAQAFGDASLQFAAGIGELIGGKAGDSLGGLVRAISAPGGVLSGQALGGRLGGAFNALDAAFGGSKKGEASVFSTEFSKSLEKTFAPVKDVLGAVKGGIDDVFGKGTGEKAAGKALAGAATGSLVSDLGRAIGINLNKTGSSIGGALGGLTGIPGGEIIGSIIGGVLGNKLAVTPRAFQNINTDGSGSVQTTFGGARGAGAAESSAAAKDIANAFSGSLGNLVSAIGGSLQANATIGAIGPAAGKFEFKTGNTTRAGYDFSGGTTQVFDSAEEAIAAGLKSVIERGLIKGLRESTRRLLLAGEDFQAQADKAAQFEGVFKELRQRKDPTGAALEDLSKQLDDLRGVFKEAGASAAEYAQLEELYQLKRSDAIAKGFSASITSMQDFLNRLNGSQTYGLSASTRYANSQAQLAQLNATRATGGTVDFNTYQTAADTFLQASRDLNGSSTQYFRDLESVTSTVQGLIATAQKQADAATASAPVVDAITQQTTETINALEAIRIAITQQGTTAPANDAAAVDARYYLRF